MPHYFLTKKFLGAICTVWRRESFSVSISAMYIWWLWGKILSYEECLFYMISKWVFISCAHGVHGERKHYHLGIWHLNVMLWENRMWFSMQIASISLKEFNKFQDQQGKLSAHCPVKWQKKLIFVHGTNKWWYEMGNSGLEPCLWQACFQYFLAQLMAKTSVATLSDQTLCHRLNSERIQWCHMSPQW